MPTFLFKPILVSAQQFIATNGTDYAQSMIDYSRISPLYPEGMYPWSKEDYRPRDMSYGYVMNKMLGSRQHVFSGDWIIKMQIFGIETYVVMNDLYFWKYFERPKLG